MICPRCKADQSTCVDSHQRGQLRYRRYRCNACRTTYHTIEDVLVYGPPLPPPKPPSPCKTCSLAVAAKEWRKQK